MFIHLDQAAFADLQAYRLGAESCVLGTRPTDTTSLLQSSACLPSALSYSTVTPRLPRLTLPMFTAELDLQPLLLDEYFPRLLRARLVCPAKIGRASRM